MMLDWFLETKLGRGILALGAFAVALVGAFFAGKREQAGRQSDHLIPPLRGHCRDALSRASHARGSCQFRDTIVAD